MSKVTARKQQYQPAVKVSELGDKFLVQTELPGVNAEGLEITVEKNVLTIKANSNYQHPEGYQVVYREFEPAGYERSFNLHEEIDQEQISANLEAGLLTVELSKKKESLKKIEVKAN